MDKDTIKKVLGLIREYRAKVDEIVKSKMDIIKKESDTANQQAIQQAKDKINKI